MKAHVSPKSLVPGAGGDESAGVIRLSSRPALCAGLVTLIFAGALTAAVSLAGNDSSTTTVAYIATAALLIVMAVISLLTAGRNAFIAYRLCAAIFSASAILLPAAAVTR